MSLNLLVCLTPVFWFLKRCFPLQVLFCFHFFFFAHSMWAQARSKDEKIKVVAPPIEGPSHHHAGQRDILVPTRLSLYEVKNHLQQESSFLLEETSRISSTGFAVPRVRGQSVELTEVYLEDIHLFDAYSGLPLFAELDLRAFGALEITKGLPPAMLNSLNPIGALRYRLLPQQGQLTAIGLDFGEPYGQSLWARRQHRLLSSVTHDLDLRLFGRWHQSSGRFPFYDHRGTPYNEADDHLAIRQQNARNSWQVLPILSGTGEHDRWHLISWAQQIEQEQPGLNTRRQSLARENLAFDLQALAWQRDLQHKNRLLPQRLSLQIRRESQSRQFFDPTSLFLGTATESQIRMLQWHLSASTEWFSALFNSYHKWEGQLAKAQINLANNADLDLQMERVRKQVYWGGLWPLFEKFALTHKWSQAWHEDEFPKQNPSQQAVQGRQGRRQQTARSHGFGFSWQLLEGSKVYGQMSEYDRPPTVLEEFGNGGGVAGNPDLKPEELQHYELGLQWQNSSASIQAFFAGFTDETKNKIVFVPRYENALVAMNLARTEVKGMEFGVHWFPLAAWQFSLMTTHLQARNTTNPLLPLKIPGIPDQTATASIGWQGRLLNMNLQARRQGEFFRDHLNGRRVPAYVLYDLGGDLCFSCSEQQAKGDWQFAWQIYNLTNVRSLSVMSQGAELSQAGRIPLSSFDGAPQPGRHYKLSISKHFY
ncbi:MAG: TonB-dependent receptor [Oligoflexus sp.]